MTGTLEIHDSIETVEPSIWDGLAAGQVYAQRDWLRAVEKGVRHGGSSRYFLYRRGSRVAAAAVAYKLSAADGPSRFDELFFGRLASHAHTLRLAPTRILYAGPLIGHGSHILCPGGRRPENDPVLDAFLGELGEYAACIGAALVVPRLPDTQSNLSLALRRAGFQETVTWPISVLETKWRDLDEYVADLSSIARNQSNKTRREIAAAGKAGVTIEYQRPQDSDHCALERLLEEHEQKYYSGMPQILPGFLAALAAHDQGNSLLITARRDEQLLGFSVLATAPPSASGPLIAVPDVPINRKAFTYFNLAFYGPIRHCLANGLRLLDIGGGMPAMKERRGFRQATVRTFVSPRGRLDSARWSLLLSAHDYNVRRKTAQ